VCVRACVFDFLACVKMRGSRDRAKWGDRDQWDRACVRGRARAEVSASPMHEIAASCKTSLTLGEASRGADVIAVWKHGFDRHAHIVYRPVVLVVSLR
jgi:hypothetical protein